MYSRKSSRSWPGRSKAQKRDRNAGEPIAGKPAPTKSFQLHKPPVGEGMPAQPIAGKPAPSRSFQLHKSPVGEGMLTQPIAGKPAPTRSFQFHKSQWELASQLPQEAFSFTSPSGRRHAHTANPWQASSHKKLSVSQVTVGEGLLTQPIAGKPAPTKSSQLHKPLCGSWLASDAGDAVLLLAPYSQSRASQTRP